MVLMRRILAAAAVFLLPAGVGLSLFSLSAAEQPRPFEVRGEYTWACSCDVVCPCTFGSPNTGDQCRFTMAYHLHEATYGNLDLSGMNLVWMSLEGPTPLIRTFMEGKAVGAIFVDERASEAQREALVDVFMRVRGPFYQKVFPARAVAIQYLAEGDRRVVRVPGVLDLQLDLIRNNGKPVEIINAPYWAPRFFVGRATRHTCTDETLGYQWDLKGKHGDYGAIHWTDKMDLYKGLLEKWKADHPDETTEFGSNQARARETAATASGCCHRGNAPMYQ